MFHPSTGYSDMPSIGSSENVPNSSTTYLQSSHSSNTPVYVPSSRAIPHTQYATGAHFPSAMAAAAQNGWPGDSFSSAHSQLPPQFYAPNAVMMSSWRSYDPTGFQRTPPYGKYKI